MVTCSSARKEIRVSVRKRPLSTNEKDIDIDTSTFIFDRIFEVEDDNNDGRRGSAIYDITTSPLIKNIFHGRKALVLTYGQSGSGKTFTIFDKSKGLCALAAQEILKSLQGHSHLEAYVGFFEIYKKQLHDLLDNRKKLMYINGLKEHQIKTIDNLSKFIDLGNTVRSTGSTGAILQIVLKNKTELHGKISFVDLAGNDTDRQTRTEGAEINKSLFTLNECIRAFDQDKKYIPFRNSKLTEALKDFFVGNSRICMIATISPNESNRGHTLNTLKYASSLNE